MGELAPRDVVSRAIVEQIRKTHFTHVYLDVRHLPTQQFRERFPQLAKLVDEFAIDMGKDLIPIHPAAHYMIGGVDVRPGRPHEPAGPVRGRRGELQRPARREPAGQQLAAGRPRLRRRAGTDAGAGGEGRERGG